jgi:hypothetical protein
MIFMKPKPGDLVCITQNTWENLGAGSFHAYHIVQDSIARAMSYEEYGDYWRRREMNSSRFQDHLSYAKQWMERGQFPFIIIKPPPGSSRMEEPGADYTFVATVGDTLFLTESQFEILDQESDAE